MLDWIFGTTDKKSQQKILAPEEEWAYDYMRSYLLSPIWKNPLLDFIEEKCWVFQDIEENKFEYTTIFNEFKGLTAMLIESMMIEVGLKQSLLEKCLIKGLGSKDKKTFQQILVCDNFLAFKRIMLAKNKELNNQALKNIGAGKAIDAKELEKLEIQKAIAMSLAINQKLENIKIQQANDLSNTNQTAKNKQCIQKETSNKQAKKSPRIKDKDKLDKLDKLPPLIFLGRQEKPISEYKLEEQNVKAQIQALRKQEKQQSYENQQDRKKRLLEQRELIRKNKKQQRKVQLNQFISKQSQTKVDQKELERRKKIMKRLKEQIDD